MAEIRHQTGPEAHELEGLGRYFGLAVPEVVPPREIALLERGIEDDVAGRLEKDREERGEEPQPVLEDIPAEVEPDLEAVEQQPVPAQGEAREIVSALVHGLEAIAHLLEGLAQALLQGALELLRQVNSLDHVTAGKSVAVVGGGPAGLTVAADLIACAVRALSGAACM